MIATIAFEGPTSGVPVDPWMIGIVVAVVVLFAGITIMMMICERR